MFRLLHKIGTLTIILFTIIIIIGVVMILSFGFFLNSNPTQNDMIGVWTCDTDSSSIVFFDDGRCTVNLLTIATTIRENRNNEKVWRCDNIDAYGEHISPDTIVEWTFKGFWKIVPYTKYGNQITRIEISPYPIFSTDIQNKIDTIYGDGYILFWEYEELSIMGHIFYRYIYQQFPGDPDTADMLVLKQQKTFE